MDPGRLVIASLALVVTTDLLPGCPVIFPASYPKALDRMVMYWLDPDDDPVAVVVECHSGVLVCD